MHCFHSSATPALQSISIAACVLYFGLGNETRAQQYAFTTIAGLEGSSGSSDGTNNSAQFKYPSEIALDQNGVLYVSDLLNHTIRQVTQAGTNWVVSTIAGMPGVLGSTDGTNRDARFNHPNGITVGSDGNLFVADHYNHTIRELRKFGTNWVVNTLAGFPLAMGTNDGTGSQARFWSPTGIAADDLGNLFVADTATFIIRMVAQSGTNWVVSTPIGTALNYGFVDATNGDAEFNNPYGITVSAARTLYVTDYGNNAIRMITPTGTDWVVTTVTGLSGNPGTNDGPGGSAMLNHPNGITLDSQTNLFVTDQDSHTIRKITPQGNGWVVSTIGGAASQRGAVDGVGDQARFNKPWGIVVDGAGKIFVADYLNQTIRMGIPLTQPPPEISFFMANNELVLSWPMPVDNYVLETSTSLNPGVIWTSIASGIFASGTEFVFTNLSTASGGFFRLRKN